MNQEDFDAFKYEWDHYPSQDNEGFQPDRGGFKCGWFAAVHWERQRAAKIKDERIAELQAEVKHLNAVIETGDVDVDSIRARLRLCEEAVFDRLIQDLMKTPHQWIGMGYCAEIADYIRIEKENFLKEPK